jgi:hypothetical protein
MLKSALIAILESSYQKQYVFVATECVYISLLLMLRSDAFSLRHNPNLQIRLTVTLDIKGLVVGNPDGTLVFLLVEMINNSTDYDLCPVYLCSHPTN